MAPESQSDPRPYSEDEYEEQLRQAGGSFPVFSPELEETPRQENSSDAQFQTGVIPRGDPTFTVDGKDISETLNNQDRLDKETAWHHLGNPAKPLTARHKEVCRLIAKGLPYSGDPGTGSISELTGYSNMYLSILSSNLKIRQEVDRIQAMVLETSIGDRIRASNHKAFDVIEEVMLDEEVKPDVRLKAASWIIEKTTGKAKQEIEQTGGGLKDFMSLLKEFKEEQAQLGTVGHKQLGERIGAESEQSFIDVTPAEKPKEDDALESWIDQNL